MADFDPERTGRHIRFVRDVQQSARRLERRDDGKAELSLGGTCWVLSDEAIVRLGTWIAELYPEAFGRCTSPAFPYWLLGGLASALVGGLLGFWLGGMR